jgi:hypothetical protein
MRKAVSSDFVGSVGLATQLASGPVPVGLGTGSSRPPVGLQQATRQIERHSAVGLTS